jgi:hypothetical protein
MSRISKDLAEQIAFKLTEKSREAVEKLHIEFREQATALWESIVPPAVQECFKAHPDWFETRSAIKLNEHGFRFDYITTTRPIIERGASNILTLTRKTADPLFRAKTKWEKEKKKYEDLKDESMSALLALKTYNNIRKELPEAAPYLPPPMSNALVVNFDSLKKKLNQQPTVTAEKVAN